MIDLMLDVETLGNIPGCVVTQVSVVPFHINGKPIETTLSPNAMVFDERLHIGEQVGMGFDVDTDTLAWWMQQDKKVRSFVMNGDMRLENFVDLYTDFLNIITAHFNDYRIWSTSAKVDFGCLPVLFKRLAVPYPGNHRAERCARTFIEMVKLNHPQMKLPKGSNTHDAIEDCKNQISHIQHAYKTFRGETVVEPVDVNGMLG